MRYSRCEGKRKEFATDSDNEKVQVAKQLDDADEEDEGGENESNKEINAGNQKYKKQIRALRVRIHSALHNKC